MTSSNPKRYFPFLLVGIVFIACGYAWLTQSPEERRIAAESEQAGNLIINHRQAAVIASKGASSLSETASSDTTATLEQEVSPLAEPVPMEERVKVLEAHTDQAEAQLGSLSAEQILDVLLEAIRSEDGVMLNVAENEPITRGNKRDGTAVEAIRSALEGLPPHLQTYLMGLLGEIGTVDALQSLLKILDTSGRTPEVRWAALEAIANIGKHRGETVSSQALSSPLEDYFNTVSTNDPQLLGAVAKGLSTVGTAEGVEKILRFMEVQEANGTTTSRLIEQMTASLRQVRNPAAIALLKARLLQDRAVERETTHMAGEALAAMGNVRATEALLQWASEVSSDAQIRRVLAWFSQVRDENSLQLLLHAEDRFYFRDPQLLARITALAERIDQQGKPQLVHGLDDREE